MSSAKKKILLVVGAVFHRGHDQGTQILLFRRHDKAGQQPQWEIPGGKIEAGETPEAALAREIWEELSVKVKVGDFIAQADHEQDHRIIRLMAYKVEHLSGDFILTDHDQMMWTYVKDLATVDLSVADVALIQDFKKAFR